MTSDKTTCLICNCEKTMPLDSNALAQALGLDDIPVHTHLCRSQLSSFEKALEGDGDITVACTQEAPLFFEVAQESVSEDRVRFFNIRENAGWSVEADTATPKIAALIRTAGYDATPARLKSVNSNGLCLVYGTGQQALQAAKLLSQKLSVTLLLTSEGDVILPSVGDIPIYRGTIMRTEGSFGNFELTVDGYAPMLPSSRTEPQFAMARDGAKTECSLILDLSNGTPLVAGAGHRDGYKRADPGDPAAILRAVIALSEMTGEFEKPIYVDYNAATCAHARSQITGCTKCLDVCPAGAISDAGDIVAIDSGVCGGCGSCHAVCPTGSIAYQYPPRADLIGRASALLSTYRDVGGERPVLLIHSDPFGTDLIAALARFGKGLPANVLPYALHEATVIGHVEMAALHAAGAAGLVFLTDPAKVDEITALEAECALMGAVFEGLGLEAVAFRHILSESDPDRIGDVLWSLPDSGGLAPSSFAPIGSKRDVGRTALGKLHEQSPERPDMIPLPQAAPYGRVEIDEKACTLCMACTSACPASAIIDTPGEPRLRFVEAACVQCGLCVKTCPESALTLVPQLDFRPAAMQPVTLYEEEPFDCVVCGAPFATKSTIERISGQLAGKHSMFGDPEKSRLIEMCENCRIMAQANSADDPFSAGKRPVVRTTQDYVDKREGKLSAKDFLIDD